MPFQETTDGQTNFCTHETKNESGICEECFGLDEIQEDSTSMEEKMKDLDFLDKSRKLGDDWVNRDLKRKLNK